MAIFSAPNVGNFLDYVRNRRRSGRRNIGQDMRFLIQPEMQMTADKMRQMESTPFGPGLPPSRPKLSRNMYEGLPREAYGTMPANRPTAQYYDAAALHGLSPNLRNTGPGWYTPGETDRFASIMGPDQLRALLPLIQAQKQTLDAQGMSGGRQWRRLAEMFPGLGNQDNEFAGSIAEGWTPLATAEQVAARGQRQRDAASRGQTYSWIPPSRRYTPGTIPPPLSAGAWRLGPIPREVPEVSAGSTSYRGGRVR